MNPLRRNYLGSTLGGTLGNTINNLIPNLGSTPAGSSWCMKAMNPSWPVPGGGAPDHTTATTVIMNFDSRVTIEMPTTATAGTILDVEIRLWNDMIRLADVIIMERGSTDISNCYTILNKQLPKNPNPPAATGVKWTDRVATDTADFNYKWTYLKSVAQKARQTFGGATLQVSAAANYDQGLMLAGQTNQSPIEYKAIDTLDGRIINQDEYQLNDFATSDNIGNMPRTLDGSMKLGAYIAHKLDNDILTFRSIETPVSTVSPLMGTTTGTAGSVPSPMKYISIAPGTKGPGVMNHNCGQIFIRGISNTTSFSLHLYSGWEVLPFADSPISIFQTESPTTDYMALQSYSQLMQAVEMDAYPADWNMFEFLGNLIRSIAPKLPNVIKGVVGGIGGGPIGMITGGLGGLMDGGDEEDEEVAYRPPARKRYRREMPPPLPPRPSGRAPRQTEYVPREELD